MAALSGTVKDANGNFASRVVRAHRKYDGSLAGEVLSDPSTGAFSITTSDQSKHYVVVHDTDSWLTYLPFNGLNNATTFDEWSGKTVTPSGNVKISTAQYAPLTGNGSSAYFDGTGGFLTIPASNDFAFGTADFTIECWVRLDSLGTERAIFDTRAVTTDTGLYFGINSSNQPYVFGNNATIVTSSTALSATTWYHLALVKYSGTMYIYVGGTGTGSAASTYYITCPSSLVVVGRKLGSTTNDFIGHVDDLRVQKGKAQYSVGFSVPSKPMFYQQDGDAYWNNVVLGCHFDGQPDNGDPYRNSVVLNMRMNGANGSTAIVEDTGKVVSAYGNASLNTTTKKYGSASCHFDGSGDYLRVADSNDFSFAGDFTIEAWVYCEDLSSDRTIAGHWYAGNASYCSWIFRVTTAGKLSLSYGIGGTNAGLTGTSVTVSTGQWTHVAVSRSGTTLKFFVDGVQDAASITLSGALNNCPASLDIGAVATETSGGDGFFQGFIGDLRITTAARYVSAFTPPAAELPALRTKWVDSASGKTITAYGDAAISATQSKFGGFSAYFDGTGDYLTIPYSSDLDFGSGDFTIDAWVNVANVSGIKCILSRYDVGAASFHLSISNANIYFTFNIGGTYYQVTTASSLSANSWNHIALVRTLGVIKMAINGVFDANTISQPGNIANPVNTTYVGLINPSYGGAFNGYMDDLRVTKGVARWVSNFTPPAAAFLEQVLTFGQKNALIYDHLTPV